LIRFLSFCFLLVTCLPLRAIDFVSEVERLSNLSHEEFFKKFRFEEYASTYDLEDIMLLESHKNILYKKGIDGDFFLITLFQQHVSKQPMDFKDLSTLKPMLKHAELLRCSDNYLPDSVFVYKALADEYLKKIADSLEVLVKNKDVDIKSFEIKYVLERLSENNYYIDIREPNLSKLIRYMKEGRWDYIVQKLKTTYKTEFLTACTIGILFSILIFFGYKKRKRNQFISHEKFSFYTVFYYAGQCWNYERPRLPLRRRSKSP